jgi:hypothetical protein
MRGVRRAEHGERDVLHLDAEIFRDRLAAGQHRDVLQHGLAAIAEARSLYSGNLEAAAQTVDDEGGESFAFDVFRDNHPAAIEVPAEVVETAVKATASFLAELKWQEDEKLRIARETEDAEWRAAFIPHAIILGERKIPTSITMCVISGGPERWLKIELDISKSSNTFVQQAIAALPSKLHLGKDGRLSVPFFGYALGFIVNYSPDQAVRYDLKGNAVENLSKAFRLGRATFSLKGGTQIGNIGRRLEVVEISTT